MMRTFAITIILAAAAAQAAAAQQRPDFSGKWTLVDSALARPSVAAVGDAAFRVGDMGSGWASPLSITQRHDSLILEFTVFSTYDMQPPIRLAYALGGSESPNAVMIGHAQFLQRATVTWQGSTLVITTTHPGPDSDASRVVEVRQALTLESPTRLQVETTRAGKTTRTSWVSESKGSESFDHR